MTTFYPEGERPDILLAKDRQEGIRRDNYYRDQMRSLDILPPQPSSDSWLNADSLREKIEEAIDCNRNSIDCTDWVESLPSEEEIEVMCDEVAIILGLTTIDFESNINLNTRNLLIYWE